jgi:tetratricopeptide (TPR) repeat protein/predicted Ser/Thr protein kinase
MPSQEDDVPTETITVRPAVDATDPTVGAVPPRVRRPTYEPGTRAGRYQIRERLAEGGMGAVYSAYDPELDRHIALKVVKVRSSPEGIERARERLLREAQALAQLSHPNVIAAYDVGTIAEDVFIAMELVQGKTLRDWVADARPTLPQKLAVMIAAGEGLAAAHAAGLIHRDFKPSNVLVGNDHRVRVVDFGLARSARGGDDHRDSPFDETAETTSSSGRLSAPLTMVGSVVGTPAYMSPEQFRGGEIDDKSDQYAFAVTLYEIVYGEKPFRAETRHQLELLVRAGKLDPPRGAKVPGWLHDVIARGLAVDPAARYPSMTALLADLTRDRLRFRRRVLAAAAAVLVLGAASAIALSGRRAAGPVCDGGRDRFAEVWSPETQGKVEAAFRETDRSYAAATYQRVATLLEERGEAWVAMRTEACEATRVRGEQSEQLLDLRMRCLDRRLAQVRTVLEILAAADGRTVDRAVDVVLGLDSLEGCADPAQLDAAYPPPSDPQRVQDVAAAREKLDRSVVVLNAGDYPAAVKLAEEGLGEADRIDYPPLRAEAMLRLGWAKLRAGEPDAGLDLLRRSAQLAAIARDDAVLAESSLSWFYVMGVIQARHEEAMAFGDLVLAIVGRAGEHPGHRADALATYGYLLIQRGQPAAAVLVLESSRALFAIANGEDHPRVAHALNYLAMAHNELGRYADGQAAMERALAIWEGNFGPDHPTLISGLINLASNLLLQHQPERARPHADRALAIAERALGPAHPKVAFALTAQGEILSETGGCAEVAPKLARAVEILEARYGAEHPYISYPLVDAGRCLLDGGDPAAAIAPLERALAIRRAAKGTAAELATASFQLGRALWDSGRDRDRARTLVRDARDQLAGVAVGRARELAEVDAWLAARQSRTRSP